MKEKNTEGLCPKTFYARNYDCNICKFMPANVPGTVVEHSPRQHKVEGSNYAADSITAEKLFLRSKLIPYYNKLECFPLSVTSNLA
jgi:hypothetical protein